MGFEPTVSKATGLQGRSIRPLWKLQHIIHVTDSNITLDITILYNLCSVEYNILSHKIFLIKY